MRRAEEAIEQLEAELLDVREENARLRAERQRALDPHQVAAELRDRQLLAALDQAEDGDVGTVLDLATTRQGLLEVCEQLQVLAGQIHRQLLDGARPPDIDRRVVHLPGPFRRRATDAEPAGPHLVPPLASPRRTDAEAGTDLPTDPLLPPIASNRPTAATSVATALGQEAAR